MRAILLAITLLLAACEGFYVENYKERFPVTVQRDTPVLLVSFAPGRAELPATEAARLDDFLAGYLQRHSGPLRLTAHRAAGERLSMERLAALEARAVGAGIPKSAVLTTLADARNGAGDAAVTYERYIANVPECGDWTKNTAVDWTNTPSSNFGCATQRNIGLQTADPRDLVGARAFGSHDPQRMSDQLVKYRTGAPTIAAQQDPTGWKEFFNPSTGAGAGD